MLLPRSSSALLSPAFALPPPLASVPRARGGLPQSRGSQHASGVPCGGAPSAAATCGGATRAGEARGGVAPAVARRTAAAVVAAAVVAVARPRGARAKSKEEAARTLTGDPEVEELRRVQGGIRLYDVKNKRFVKLPELLRPGELLHDADVVCIGEYHDSAADHTMQRLILDALTYELFLELRKSEGVDPTATKGVVPQNLSSRKLALGVEYFNRPQQEVLDKFIFGDGSMNGVEFRKAIDWENVWSYDWSIYAPLFRFCQLNKTRIVGLNLPNEVSLQVSRNGLDASPAWLKEQLPELDLSKPRHRRRFEDLLKMSPEEAVSRMSLPLEGFTPRSDLDKIYESQVLWDECMAETAQKYLAVNGGRLVVLAGLNHCWRDALPDRLEARAARSGGRALRVASVVPWRGSMQPEHLPTCADYVWCDLALGACEGGGAEASAAMQAQRTRLQGHPRVFPAGYM